MGRTSISEQLYNLTSELRFLQRDHECMTALLESIRQQFSQAQTIYRVAQDMQQKRQSWIDEIVAHLITRIPEDVSLSSDCFIDPEDIELFTSMTKIKQKQRPQNQSTPVPSDDEVAESTKEGFQRPITSTHHEYNVLAPLGRRGSTIELEWLTDFEDFSPKRRTESREMNLPNCYDWT